VKSLPIATEVVIVGAGPTGLALACVLAQAGINFVLLDRLAEGANTSRAAVIHARTLEVLEELGVADRLVKLGRVVPKFTLRDRDRALASIYFDRLPTRYPYTLMLPQYKTEAILLERLRELGGDVHRPYVVENIQQDAGGVTLTIWAGGRPSQLLRARYVIGADGMQSVVREQAGIGFTGGRYAESFILADVHMDWPLSGDEVMLFLSPEGLAVVVQLPGGTFRIVATVDDAPEHPTLEDVQQILDRRGPTSGPVKVHDVVWSSRFRVHHRVADQYRKERVFLAGDAAHVHSPAGGQGMNTGIQDAIALGKLLAEVVAGKVAQCRLDLYEQKRRPVAARVVAFTDRMTRFATLRSTVGRKLRNLVLRIVGSVPALPAKFAYELSGLRNR
jgi:2-polyprenyl-6-methoxyphenol hydroxylase-like FAD-dependent oxidoreductase